MDDKIYISWDEFHRDVRALCNKIREDGRYDKIIAISRGGMLPAGIIAYELNIRQTAVVNIATYVGSKHLKIDKIDIFGNIAEADEKTLIVDDLSDSGQTLQIMRRRFPRGKFVTVYVKPRGKGEADLFSREMPDEWIVFPWDVE